MSVFESNLLDTLSKDEPSTKQKSTIMVHGVNLVNFTTSIASGGFAYPSCGIIKVNKDLKENPDFSFSAGNILVAFKPEILFNGKMSQSQSKRVSDITTGDGYTVRAPTERITFGGSEYSQFDKMLTRMDSPFSHDYLSRKLDRVDKDFWAHYEAFMRSDLIKHLFVKEKGFDVREPTKLRTLDSGSFAAYLRSTVKGKRLSVYEDEDSARSTYQSYLSKVYSDPVFDDCRDDFLGEVPVMELHKLDRIFKSAYNHIDQLAARPTEIDTEKLQKNLDKAMKDAGGISEYKDWVITKIRSMAKNVYYVTPEGNKFTDPSRVISYMKRSSGQGKEAISSFGVGELKSLTTNYLDSFEEIMEHSHLLTSDESEYESESLKKSLNDFKFEITEASSLLDSRSLMVEKYEVEKKAVIEVCLRGRTVSSVADKLGLEHVSDEVMAQLESLGAKLRTEFKNSGNKVPYFEAVINDRVDLNQVARLIVPKSEVKAVTNLLHQYGYDIPVKAYNPSVKGSQMKQFPISLNLESQMKKLNRQNKVTKKLK